MRVVAQNYLDYKQYKEDMRKQAGKQDFARKVNTPPVSYYEKDINSIDF